MMETIEAVILKGIGGFYYICWQGREIECKAGGRLRLRRDFRPAVGDLARVELRGQDEGLITDILPRRSFLLRPPVANIDQLMIVASEADPETDPYLIDKVVVIALRQGIQPAVVLNKADLRPSPRLEEIYRQAGFPTIQVSAQTGQGLEELRRLLKNKISAFTGNSGVGKSSLLNRLEPGVSLETGAISRISRGRHTTRRVELFPLQDGGYAADTPGFSSFDISRIDRIPKEELEQYFPEFEPYIGQCRFSGCAHCKEPDCAVDQAARQGRIAPSRLESYRSLYEEMAKRKEWQTN